MSKDIYLYHIVYRTTNLITNKIYVGVHSTNNLNDGYIGSGINIKESISKYGKENFIREILYVYDNRQEALNKESEIVDENFIKRQDTYNAAIGGGRSVYKYGSDHPSYGKKLSKSHKEKISQSNKGNKSKTGRTGELHPLYGKRGVKSPNAKKALVNGIIYNSCIEAAEAHGITKSTFSYWIKTGKAKKL